MSRRLRFALVAAIPLALGAWYLFRPERALLDRTVSEAAPLGGTVISAGQFESRAHDGRGRAEVLQLAGGRVLRFSGFEVLDGPDLQVYLLADPAASGRGGLRAGFVSLGALKGNIGDQHYVIPDSVALERYPAVAVWCRRFGVNFATARLL